jgi:hypothetical protein
VATDTITVANAFTQAIASGVTYTLLRTAHSEAPGAGATDWTSGEKEQLRHRLGIDGTATAPAALTFPSLRATKIGTVDTGAGTASFIDAERTEASDKELIGAWVLWKSGSNAGQARQITAFATGTDTVTYWPSTASATATGDVYEIMPQGAADVGLWRGIQPGLLSGTNVLVDVAAISTDSTAADNLEAFFDGQGYDAATSSVSTLRKGTAQAGAASTITLDAGASATDDFYNNTILQIMSGTGSSQSRIISDYVGSTKVATVNGNWITNPDTTSVFVIHPFGAIPGATAPTAAENADAVWDELRSGHVVSGSFGEYTLADVVRISGDAVAADNFETMLDGTGGQVLSLKQLNIVNTTGHAFVASSTGSNGRGMDVSGHGTGDAAKFTGGATSGVGIGAVGGTNADGIVALGGVTSGNGISCAAQTSGSGLVANGAGAGHGFVGTGGASGGAGVRGTGGASGGAGITGVANDTGQGAYFRGGATSGPGMRCEAPTSGHGMHCTGATNNNGALFSGHGTGDGIGAVGGTDSVAPGDGIVGYAPGNVAAPGGGAGINGSADHGIGIACLVTATDATAAFLAWPQAGNVDGMRIRQSGTGESIKLKDDGSGNIKGNLSGNVTGSVGSLAAQAKTDVNVEVNDVINVDTKAEVTVKPAANASLGDKMGYAHALRVNKLVETATQQRIRNSADSADAATSTLSDDGTTFTQTAVI